MSLFSLRIQILILSILIYIIFPINCQLQGLAKQQTCLLRCVAFCLTKGGNGENELQACEQRCKPYGEPGLCSSDKCWRKCRDLDDINPRPNKPDEKMKPIDNFTFIYDEQYLLSISWNPVPNADIYVVVHWATNSILQYSQIITTSPFLHNFTFSPHNLCQENAVQVVPISGIYGTGPMSEPNVIPPPRPQISPRLKLLSMIYEPKKYVAQNYEANGTITIKFGYEPSAWPLGDEDLEVIPMFHMMLCAEPDLTQAVPVPEFSKGKDQYTIEGQVGSDMMYRKCKFIYSIQEVHSDQCDISEYVHAKTDDFGNVEISCDNVQNSECYKIESHRGPVCGQVDKFTYDVLEKDKISWSNKASNISVNISYVPYSTNPERKPLYYVALYGDALSYESSEELFKRSRITQLLQK
uniref:Uncharacterized protein n=1 Tax=Panagrolaimus sp. PS1159 TaxID=55785 RepID=A0AC35FMZ6_9BILA